MENNLVVDFHKQMYDMFKKEESEVKNVGIGQQAPDFTAMTTYGPINFSEFNKGKWVIFFSHPRRFYTGLYYRIYSIYTILSIF